MAGERYIKYTERPTGWEKNACIKHFNGKKQEEWDEKRREYGKKINEGDYIMLENDASGSYGQRWAFVVFHGDKEIHRAHGYTEGCGSITPAEGFAIIKALEWLKEADFSPHLPIILTNDNYAVLSKLHSGSEKGTHRDLWHQLNELFDPLRRSGRLFILGHATREAHGYAQKDQVGLKQ
ncbi:MAG: hypothetical protein KAW45_02440 [Thermoplasmatales archaeon]|nr:hypothetical protein [Thermoplasmatales archaeon]